MADGPTQAAVVETGGADAKPAASAEVAFGTELAAFFSQQASDNDLGAHPSRLYERFRLRNGVRVGRYSLHLPVVVFWLLELAIVVTTAFVVLKLSAGTDGIATAWQAVGRFSTLLVLTMVGMGLFTRRQRDRVRGLVLRISICVLAASSVAALVEPLFESHISLPELMAIATLVWVMLVMIRVIASRFVDEERYKRRVMVLGAGRNAAHLNTLRRRTDRRTFTILGHIPLEGDPILVTEDQLLEADRPLQQIAAELRVDEIVYAADDRRRNFPARALLDCRLAGIEVSYMINFLERESGRVYLDLLSPSWLIFGNGFRRDLFRHVSKRGFDIAFSSLLLGFAGPLMLLAALAIKLEEGWSAPIFYRQKRVGFLGNYFNIVKFRSMRVDAEQDGKAQWATPRDSRVTRVGNFMRRTRVDELPQLLSILGGKMSFVGPRPERPEFVKQLSKTIPFYQERHAIKPGLTGWAQLCYPYGASEHDAREKQQYDLYYVKHHSILFDLKILLETVEVVLLGKGAR